jgi:hypothetical protein
MKHAQMPLTHERSFLMKAFLIDQAPLIGIVAISGVTMWLLLDAFRAVAMIHAALAS